MSETVKKTADMLAEDRTDMALERTSMAADRTLMAWTRTSLSMISFGFTVFKFMEAMQKEGKNILVRSEQDAQHFGMMLISLGVICLIVACIQYWQLDKKLHLDRKWYTNLTFISAGFIALMGLLALANTLFDIGPL
jgi:putative membrane protein